MDEIIGSYSFSKTPIGKGSYSLVYCGKNMITDELVAIKRIIFMKNEEKDRIEKEINIMKSLQHKNIIKLYDVVYDDSSINIVMEYCEFGDLSTFLSSKPLKEKYAKKIMIQIKDAVKYLYDNNVFHRDIKTQNILLTKDKTIKLGDFGLAKLFNSNEKKLSSTICGSPIYMAPEIIKCNNYGTKTDLWSIGVILYEMITGRPPFKAKNHIELIRKIDTTSVYIPMTFLISTECRDMINGLLQKEPESRMNWDHFFNHPWLVLTDSQEEKNLLDFVKDYDYMPPQQIYEISREIRVPSSPRESMFPVKSNPISIKKNNSRDDMNGFEDAFISPMFNKPIMLTPNSNDGYVVVRQDDKNNVEIQRSITQSLINYLNKTIDYFT